MLAKYEFIIKRSDSTTDIFNHYLSYKTTPCKTMNIIEITILQETKSFWSVAQQGLSWKNGVRTCNYKYVSNTGTERVSENHRVWNQGNGRRSESSVVKDLSQVWNGRSDMKYVLSTCCGVTVPLSSWRLFRQSEHVCVCVWVYEWAQGCTQLRSTEVCEVSLTKNLRGKPAKTRLEKAKRILATCVPLTWASSFNVVVNWVL